MNDHRELARLFGEVQSGKGDRQALVEEIAARLTAHSRAEEAKVYPAIRKADPAESDDVDHAYHEHDEADELLQRVVRNVDAPEFA